MGVAVFGLRRRMIIGASALDAAYVDLGAGAFRATALTRGPWNPDHQHAGPPSALMARAIERAAAGEGLTHLGRLTVNLLRPAPIGESRRPSRQFRARPDSFPGIAQNAARKCRNNEAICGRAYRNCLKTGDAGIRRPYDCPCACPCAADCGSVTLRLAARQSLWLRLLLGGTEIYIRILGDV